MTLECEVVLTESGAPAMRDRLTGELMHPLVGPLVEAERLYIAPSRLAQRLAERADSPLVLFDVGLGAGSNAAAAWKTAQAAPESGRRLSIVSFDRSRAALELALLPAHAPHFGFDAETRSAAQAVLEEGRCSTPRAEWRLHEGELPYTLRETPAELADLVFWDPFSPLANPELWNFDSFAQLRRCCRPGAGVYTYSGATRIRSALLLAGFEVGFGVAISPGRDATEAVVAPASCERALGRRWLERLSRSSHPFPLDAPRDAFARVSAMPQFHGEVPEL
jgi:queuine tRNA-ribosyltransferase